VSQAAAGWQVGDVILDTYEVRHIFTSGGMGLVYRVHHRGWNMELALKSPRAELFTSAGGKESFVREAETWVDLGLHPHIVACYYVRTIEEIPRVFAEYVEGGSLKDWIEDQRLYEGGQARALERMLDIAIQFAWGLAYSHERGLVHQDVKPANVLITPEGVAKVSDFGLAKARAAAGEGNGSRQDRRGGSVPASANQPGGSMQVSFGGMTPAYCSPEQGRRGGVTRKTDLWSWGVSVLEMYTGEVTWYSGQAAGEALEGYLETGAEGEGLPPMPGGVVKLLQQCFQENPADRPADMLEVAGRLQEIYRQTTGKAYPRKIPKPVDLLADSLNNRALSLLDLSKEAEAVQVWEKAQQAAPHHLETIFNVGDWRWNHGEYSDTALLERLNELHGIYKESADYWYHLGCIHVKRGDLVEAASTLMKCVEVAPDTPQALLALAILNVKIPGKQADAEQVLARLSEKWPGWMQDRLGTTQPAQAMKQLEQVDLPIGRLIRYMEKKVVAPPPGQAPIRRGYAPIRYPLSSGTSMWVQEAAFAPDGRRAYTTQGGKIKEWDVQSGDLIRELGIPTFGFHAFTQDGKSIVCMTGGQVCCYDLQSEVCLGSVTTPAGRSSALKTKAIHPNRTGEMVILSTDGLDGTFILDLTQASLLHNFDIRGRAKHLQSTGGFTPSGAMVLTGGGNSLCVWNLGNGLLRRVISTGQGLEDGWISYLIPLPDNRRVLLGTQSGALQIWDFEAGVCLHKMEGHTSALFGMGISQDGRLALSASHDTTMRLWDLESVQCLRTFTGFNNTVTAVAFSPDGEMCLSGVQDGKISLWQIHYPRGEHSELAPVFRPVLCKPASALAALQVAEQQGSRLDTIQKMMNAGAWAEAYAGLRQAQSQPGYGQHADILSHIAQVGLHGRRLALHDAWLSGTLGSHAEKVKAVAISEDKRLAASAGEDGEVVFWDLPAKKRLGAYKPPRPIGRDRLTALSFSTDGRNALLGSSNWAGINKTCLVEVASSRLLRAIEHPQKTYVEKVYFYPNDQHALVRANGIEIFDLTTGRIDYRAEVQKPALAFAVLPVDARFLLHHPGEQETLLLDMLFEQQIGRWPSNLRHHRFAVAGDRSLVVMGGDYGRVEAWALPSAEPLYQWKEHTDSISHILLTPDGGWAITASGDLSRCKDATIRIWNLHTGKCEKILEGHTDRIESLALSPDGRFLVSGSSDRSVCAWELDWEYEFPPQADWDARAQIFLETFLRLHASDGKSVLRQLKPTWSVDDYQRLLVELSYRGYGWLKPEGVRRELERMARERS
jgi:WD40 repeat protein/serine/threonine protein kinase